MGNRRRLRGREMRDFLRDEASRELIRSAVASGAPPIGSLAESFNNRFGPEILSRPGLPDVFGRFVRQQAAREGFFPVRSRVPLPVGGPLRTGTLYR